MNNIRQLWNIKKCKEEYKRLYVSDKVLFLSDGGINPWCVENIAVDEATLRYVSLETPEDNLYFHKVMNPGNPFSEPPEESLLFNKDVGVLVSYDETTPRNVFCYVRRSNRTNKNSEAKKEAETERCNQEAFEIATSIDPSFLLTIPCSKTPLSKYLASTMMLMAEKLQDKMSPNQKILVRSAAERLVCSGTRDEDEVEDRFYESL